MNAEEKKAAEEAAAKIKEVVDKRNSDRLDAMNAIADHADEEKDARGEPYVDDSEEKEEAAAKEDEEAQKYARNLQEEGAEAEKQEDSDTKLTNGETYYRQMVNGREKWQTLKQIRESASKVDSADEYLRTASESVKNASRLALSPKDEQVSFDEDEVQKLLAAAQLGDEDATKKVASLLVGLSREVRDAPGRIDRQLSFRTEQSRLEEKSEDLLKDPYMGRLFRSRLNELKEENPTMGLREAYTSIDSELRGAFPGFKTSKLQEKIERKRTLPIPPNAASRAGTAVEEEGEDEDWGQQIKEIAKARGKSAVIHPGPQRDR